MNKRIILVTIIGLTATLIVCLLLTCKKVRTSGDLTFKIGAVLPLTGKMAYLGETGKNGLLFAQDYINNQHLLKGGKLEIILEDGMGDQTTSIKALNHLLAIQSVNAIFSIVSDVDVAIMNVQRNKQFLFVSHCTHPALSGVNERVFRHSPTVIQEIEIIGNYIGSDSLDTVLLSMTDDYGTVFSSLAKEKKIVMERNIYSFNSSDPSIKTLCIKAIKDNPKKVIICGNGKDLYKIVKALREISYTNEIITTLGFKVGGSYETIKDFSDFTFINFKEPKVDTLYQSLVPKYKARFGKDMTLNEMIFFNTTMLLVEAINNADNWNDVDGIARNLSNTSLYNGLGETISVSKTNDILPQLDIFYNIK